MPITLDARRDLVRQCVPLSIWLARRLAGRGMAFRHAITTCTNIYRFTILWDGEHHPAEPPLTPGWSDPRWEDLLDQLERIDGKYPAGDASAAMEAEAMEFLWPLMEPRLERDVAAWPAPESKPFGFFGYHVGDTGWSEGKVTLHLSNPFAPESPFKDMGRRAGELARLLHHARQQCPDLHTVFCTSWISGYASFQALFPVQFAQSASRPRPLAYHLGWWGQFINRAGGFQEGPARHLRTTGQFRYPSISCACPIDMAFAYLRDRFNVQGG